jgi:DNA-binding NarL/FixJ family response regulator
LIHVTLVTPNPALRVGLREILGSDPDLTIVSEAGSPEELDPPGRAADMLVTASVPWTDLVTLTPAMAVLLLTDRGEDARGLARAVASAWGVLPLNASEEEILAAVHALSEGLWVGAPALVGELLKRPAAVELSAGEEHIEPVTPREMEVLQLIARGLANKQIAVALGISEHTVKFHLSALYAKLGATNRTEAVRIGTQQGMIIL